MPDDDYIGAARIALHKSTMIGIDLVLCEAIKIHSLARYVACISKAL